MLLAHTVGPVPEQILCEENDQHVDPDHRQRCQPGGPTEHEMSRLLVLHRPAYGPTGQQPGRENEHDEKQRG